MAFYEYSTRIGFKDVGNSNSLTNLGFLNLLEDAAGFHSDSVGCGLNNVKETHLAWILLNWKLQIYKRPIYAETVHIKTWARDTLKFYTFRDFEMYDTNNNLLAKASTRWALVDIDKRSYSY